MLIGLSEFLQSTLTRPHLQKPHPQPPIKEEPNILNINVFYIAKPAHPWWGIKMQVLIRRKPRNFNVVQRI